jgi:hypothetical protein
MRIYLVDGTDEQAALRAAAGAGYPACSVHHSDHLGLYLDAPGISPLHELDLLAAVRVVDPSAGTTAFWIDDEAVSAP